MHNSKKRPLRGGKGLKKLSYFVCSIPSNLTQLVCHDPKGGIVWRPDSAFLILLMEGML